MVYLGDRFAGGALRVPELTKSDDAKRIKLSYRKLHIFEIMVPIKCSGKSYKPVVGLLRVEHVDFFAGRVQARK